MRHMVKTGLLIQASLLAFAPQAAFAQNADDVSTDGDIIVTAQRRAERAIDVPISITTLDATALETANVQGLSGISKLTPGLRFDNQTNFAQPTIRGVGTSVVTSGGGSNVGIYVDGFYSPNPLAADFELLNVQNIQVLKGPQGTLFGRNSTGGAILVQTADPSTEPTARMKVSYGRFDQKRAQAYASAGLNDRIAFDVEGSYRSGDGFQTNIITGSKKDGSYENWTVRAGLKIDVSDSVSVLLRYGHSDLDDPTFVLTNNYVDPVLGQTEPNFAPPGTFTSDPDLYAANAERFFRSKNDSFQGTIKADLGFADLTSYSQYRTEKADTSFNLGVIGITIFQLGLPVTNATYSQEFLLTSKPGGALQWTTGLFYFQNRDTYRTFIDNNAATIGRIPLGGSSATARSYAAFADVTYEVTPQLFITAGARFAHDQIDDAYYIPAFSGARTYVTDAQSDAVSRNRLTPRIVVRYKPSDRSSIYASYTQGYKAAVLDVGGATGNPVNPEKVNAFEIGYKFDDRTASLEVAGFYYDYKDLQVSLFAGNPPSAQILNAASSEIYGLEGQSRFEVTPALTITIGAAWTHARYKTFNNAPVYSQCPGVGGCGGGTSFFTAPGLTLRNVPMTRTPAFTSTVGAQHRSTLAGGELLVSGNLYYSSKFNFGPSGIQFPQKAYEQLALRAQWTDASDRYTVALFGDNITGTRYRTQVQYNNFGIGSTWNAPTSYGVEFGVKF